jgi:hypothetical protein
MIFAQSASLSRLPKAPQRGCGLDKLARVDLENMFFGGRRKANL